MDHPSSLTPAYVLPTPRAEAAESFTATARKAGLDPHCPWVGGYAAYEWAHLRPVLLAYGLELAGCDVIELGCNVGGSAVTMAALGAQVEAVDIDPKIISVASANIAQHDLSDSAVARHVADTRAMPFADNSFDFALANSVLEYVAPDHLAEVIGELARILRPGGKMLICGTDSRLAPYAAHEGKWAINYIPRWMDRMTGKSYFRGLAPWELARAMQGQFTVINKERWLDARTAVHGNASASVRAVARIARVANIAPGWISPSIELLLRVSK